MSVMAVVAKAQFEKQARKDGALLALGAVWPTDSYHSENPNLQPLSSGGSLYLVTVRPGEKLWLVAVITRPVFSAEEGSWSSLPNGTPITDITSLISQLKFASGKGITAAAGKLGMSLQTPRQLTSGDVALLESLLPKTGSVASQAYASAVEATPSAQQAAADAVARAAEAKQRGLQPLALERYHRWRTWSDLPDSAKTQTDAFRYGIEEAEEFGHAVESMDVVDVATGKVAYQFYLWPFGSGVLFADGSSEPLADVVQHHFQARTPNAKLRESMAVAYQAARSQLGINEMVEFNADPAEAHPPPPPPSAPTTSIAERIAELRRRGQADEKEPRELWPTVTEALANIMPIKGFRPIPLRRPFELSDLEREALHALLDFAHPPGAYWNIFAQHGLPYTAGALARFLGRTPPTVIDETIALEGHPHPVWALVSDATYQLRPAKEVIDLLVESIPRERLPTLWRGLVELPMLAVRSPIAITREEESRGLDPKKSRAHLERFVDFMVQLYGRVEDPDRKIATELANARREPKSPDEAAALIVALRSLQSAGALDESYDDNLAAIAANESVYSYVYAILPSLVLFLQQLPPARAQRIAGHQLYLVLEIPSMEGAAGVLQWLEAKGHEWYAPEIHPKIRRLFVQLIGEPMRPLLEEALARKTAQPESLTVIQECLDRLTKAGAKKSKK